MQKEGIWSRQNKGVAERATRDKVVLDEVEGSSLEASRKAMERKAKLYDKLRKHGIEGTIQTWVQAAYSNNCRFSTNFKCESSIDDTLAEEVLVDFDSKPRDDSSVSSNITSSVRDLHDHLLIILVFESNYQDADEGAEKKDDQSVNDPWVEYVDEFGRTRVVRKSELPEDLPSQSG